MRIAPIRTHTIRPGEASAAEILGAYLPSRLPEGSIVAITSKLVSLCERAVVPRAAIALEELVLREADWYVPAGRDSLGFPITIKHGLFIGAAGVDESNADDCFVLLPRDPQSSANGIRAWLQRRHGSHVGAMLTDSRSLPLRRGTSGIGLAHSGFSALVDYADRVDLFGRSLGWSAADVLDGLAAAVVASCGEGAEQTPLALITEVPFVTFQDRDPTESELAALRVTLEGDYWATIFQAVRWQRGGGGYLAGEGV
jgi:F420-0:gamma-glutamyl ligase